LKLPSDVEKTPSLSFEQQQQNADFAIKLPRLKLPSDAEKSPRLNLSSELSPRLNLSSEISPRLNLSSEKSPRLNLPSDAEKSPRSSFEQQHNHDSVFPKLPRLRRLSDAEKSPRASVEQQQHNIESAFAQLPREVTLQILFNLVSLFTKNNEERDFEVDQCVDRTEEYVKLAKEFDLPIMMGSALYNQGVNEVFDYLLTQHVDDYGHY
jgi:hypothetical protein